MIDRKQWMGTAMRGLGTFVVLVLLLAGWGGAAASPTAQEAANGGLMSIGIAARTEGREHTIGAHFTVTSEEGEYISECTLDEVEWNGSVPPWLQCTVDVPSDRISLVWEDLDSIPAGYAPVENPIAFDPTTYRTGPHDIGVTFNNVPQDDTSSLVDEIVRILIQILTEILGGSEA